MKSILLALCLIGLCAATHAQSTPPRLTAADYERTVSFLYANYHNSSAFNLRTTPHWLPDSTGL